MKRRGEGFVLRLFVAGNAPNSERAIANLRAICERYVSAPYRTEVIDVIREPGRAMAEGVLVTPTLIKVAPLPTRTLIGDLNESEAVLSALGISES